jgi:hypothetical protein
MYLKGIVTLCTAALCPDRETTIRASGSNDAVIRVYDKAGNVIVTYASRQPPFALTI